MAALVIQHTFADGSSVSGTARGDGSAEVLKRCGWRWSRNAGVWFLQRSREKLADRAKLERTAELLRANGFAVELEIDNGVGDVAALEAARAERAEVRAERLQERAARQQGAADAAYQRSHDLVAGIPFGQPILVGHHSEAADRRRRERSWDQLGRSVKLREAAAETARRASEAASATGARNNPVTVANRIERLAAEVRGLQRSLEARQQRGADTAQVSEQLNACQAQMEYWREIRAHQIAAGDVVEYGRDNVAVGDLVKIRSSWYRVTKCNAKTVAVLVDAATGHTLKSPWTHVSGHQAAARES